MSARNDTAPVLPDPAEILKGIDTHGSRRERVLRTMRTLSPAESEILVLRHLHKRTVAEIAPLTGMPCSMVQRILDAADERFVNAFRAACDERAHTLAAHGDRSPRAQRATPTEIAAARVVSDLELHATQLAALAELRDREGKAGMVEVIDVALVTDSVQVTVEIRVPGRSPRRLLIAPSGRIHRVC